MSDEQVERYQRKYCQRRGLLVTVISLCCLGSVVMAQAAPEPLRIVSNPPPATVPSDPLQGIVFGTSAELSASSPMFDATGGPVSLEYLRLDSAGTAYLTFDDGPSEDAPGGVMVVPEFLTRDVFTATDQLITGEATGLVAPKDLLLLEDGGNLVVSDFGGAKVSVFASDTVGDVPPLFELTDLGVASSGEPRRPWGLAYDAAQDRLFVGSTDGTVLVFDAFIQNRGEAGPTRTLLPAFNGEQVSANAHDLIYVSETDRLIVADVGSATTADQEGFATDGKIFVLENAGTADGLSEVRLMLAGDSTLLGNPVGLAFDGKDLYVTEKAGNVVLRFDGILDLKGELDQFPSGVLTVAAPEGIELVPAEAE